MPFLTSAKVNPSSSKTEGRDPSVEDSPCRVVVVAVSVVVVVLVSVVDVLVMVVVVVSVAVVVVSVAEVVLTVVVEVEVHPPANDWADPSHAAHSWSASGFAASEMNSPARQGVLRPVRAERQRGNTCDGMCERTRGWGGGSNVRHCWVASSNNRQQDG